MGADFASDLGICPGCHNQVLKTDRTCSTCGIQLLRNVTTVLPPLSSFPPGAVSGQRISFRPRGGEDGLSTADPLIGATVADRYRIISMIGRGGMGVVYKAEHSKIGKVMALKLLTGELARDRDTVRRFKREALLVSKLSHPNTVQVFDYGSVGGLTYLAMEYLSGRDLGDMLDQSGPCSFEQIAKIAIQACGALKEAHDQGMVHRDIKPENLFLTRGPAGEEVVKVLDFGLAKLRESKDLNEITSSGNIVGTPYYMPPEQVRGEEVDARGDVYAMCALIYTCITGTHVFEAASPVVVLTQQVTGRVIPPHERAPHLSIPVGVSNILLKGLEKSPQDRFPSIAALQDALAGQLQGTSFTRLQLPEQITFETGEAEAATRDEVERYERTLRRQKWLAR
ncbi:MAG TPA: serine/threonine-protein kinase, partial [Polyangiaceae bacterium]|nr:serine/threonine-protein kinase [Polyangiaceae bacterium]